MANKKITQLVDIENDIDNSDILHIIDGPDDATPINKKVSVANLRANTFSNIPNPLNISGLLNLSQTPQDIASQDGSTSIVIGVDTTITRLALTATSNQTFALLDGTEGQLKFIVMTARNGENNGVVTPTNLLGAVTTLTFDAVGDSVLLLFTNGNWAVISNNGVEVTTV